ncbi:DUF58 domain-containing protein [uncultured Aeromicrobium sp.]|uniref:DUF58 domain-containing protein n=1 Tax=uncultured Aeromicrobium sp. TaxID=337820 RepID=UPI0025CEED7E|nr:DUF58 domain-containing protein [uncultured Aeromicrobium sp.]
MIRSRWPRPTRRGVVFLIVAVLAVVLAHAASVPVLVHIGGLLAVIVVVSMLAVACGRPAWSAQHDVEPRVADPDEPILVRVQLAHRGTSALDAVEWREDASGGGHGGLLLDEGRGRGPSAHYELRLSQRGRHRIGPTSVRVSDPFGLTSRWVELPGESSVVVLPRRVPLSPDSALMDVLGGRDELVAPAAVARGHAEPDVLARPYRLGDPVKRLHWKATAHRGSLMVRQEEHQSRRRVVLVVELRGSDERELDWRTGAAASVLERLHRDGADVQVVVGEHVVDVASHGSLSEALVALALAAPSSRLALWGERAAHRLVFAGRVDIDLARAWLAELDRVVTVFAHASSDEHALALLRREGWTCLTYRDRDDVAQLWQEPEVWS